MKVFIVRHSLMKSFYQMKNPVFLIYLLFSSDLFLFTEESGNVDKCSKIYNVEDCSSEYEYVEEFNGFIKFHINPEPWYDAREICEAENGNLVTIDTEQKSNALRLRIPQNHIIIKDESGFWIGANDGNQEGRFVWADDTPLKYSKWAEDEPDSKTLYYGFKDGVDCVLVATWTAYNDEDHWKWFDRDCNYSLPFICEKYSKKCSSSCYTYMEPYKTCIKLHAIPEPWQQAKGQCERENGQMLVVDSLDKQEAITKKVKNLRMAWWIADSRLKNYDNLFNNLGPHEPNGQSVRVCVVMNFTDSPEGPWNEMDCNTPLHYICETPIIL